MRKTAFDIVYGTLENEKHSDDLFHWAIGREDVNQALTRQEKNFVRRLSYGTIERTPEMDGIINHFSKTPVKKMKPVIRTILRMGIYELIYMDSIPAAATCNEMVKLAKKKKFQHLGGFVNGVLRSVARTDKEELRRELLAECRTAQEALSFTYSMPLELTTMLVKQYGKKTTEKILASFYKDKPMTIRVQKMNADSAQVRKELEQAGVVVSLCTYLEEAFHIAGFERLETLPGFAEGHFTVQDESSMLPVLVSGIRPGNRVVDVCSSPGGKALHAVDRLRGEGMVSARDVSEKKIQKIKENAERLKAPNLDIKIWDGTCPDGSWFQKADVVIADVPCSGIGVIGRKPEIKYSALSHAGQLKPIQRQIVRNAADMVKPGGTLIYSTCTINPAENEENADWIAQELSLTPVSLDEYLPKKLQSKMTARGMLQILPGIHEGDGFFVAKFIKEA